MLNIEQTYTANPFKSSRVAPSPQIIAELEEAVKAYLGDEEKEVLLLSSKEAALHYALKACDVKPTFEVCMPSFASEEVVKEVLRVNAIPVFVGSEPDTWNMDADLLEDAIDERISLAHIKPQAVILNSAYGMPASMHRFNEISFRRRIPLIEYSADGLGSEFYGRKLGTYGWHLYGILSFKDGGAALICGSKENKERILKQISRRKSAQISIRCAIAAMEEMQNIDARVAHQKRIQSLYEELLRDVDGITVHSQPDYNLSDDEPPFYDSNYRYCTALFDNNIKAETICGDFNAAGIDVQPLYKPLHANDDYLKYPSYTNGVCESLYRCGVSLPSGVDVMEEDVKIITEKIRDMLA